MPLTLAHPAAVLPLLRLWRGAGTCSGLVLGNLAPDFVYWLPLDLRRAQSHSLPGVLWFCLPAGWIALALFHGIVRRPLEDWLPEALRCRVAPLPDLDGKGRFLPVSGALIAGALLHIAWDSFTHGDGAAVERLPALATVAARIGSYPLRWYKVLQHGSSLLGLAVVVAALLRWCRRTEPRALAPVFSARKKRWLWGGLAALAAGTATLAALHAAREEGSLPRAATAAAREAAVTGIAVLVAALLLMASLAHLFPPRCRAVARGRPPEDPPARR